MTTGKDTASFFENGTTEQFEYCYKLYPQVLKMKAEKRGKKPQELIRLDHWYQNELPKLIKARGKDAHIEYDELVQTMKWKQSRGKFYPQLSYLVKVNTPRAVMTETKKAFRKLPNLEQAITALSNLKGVGTTMASALLAAAAPDSAPFMADECLMAIPEIEGIDYTTKEYLNFVQHIQATVTRLNAQAGGDTPFWSPHRVELALWAHYVANDLSPEILDNMPGPGAGGGTNINTNGNNLKNKVLDEGSQDNTNDMFGEALGEATRIGTVSETYNENTNPGGSAVIAAAVDGDSNFVSNDSTSQEPLIDENTTQTTATTSTDEGEAGTPLASDSESNIEAPSKFSSTVARKISSGAMIKSENTTSKMSTTDLIKNDIERKEVRSCSNVGNGNGPFVGVNLAGDSADGESSSCALANDDIASDADDGSDIDDRDADMARLADDNSNSNNSNSQKMTTLTTNCVTLGHKRPHNSCSAGDAGNSEGLLTSPIGHADISCNHPDPKKVRSD